MDNASGKEKGTLELIYTPGVAYVALEISNNKKLAYDLTSKWNNVAIVCDGTRVLGLGNVGPEAALTVMEGKSVLFKALAGINAIPLCISARAKEEIIQFVKAIQPSFGAINIEDIESPKVLEIVEILKKEVDIPVFPRRSTWNRDNYSSCINQCIETSGKSTRRYPHCGGRSWICRIWHRQNTN